MKRIDQVLSNPEAVRSAAPAQLPATAEERDTGCSRCRGTGFVVRVRDYTDPRFGRTEPCDCVLQEQEETRRSRLQQISQLGTLTRYTFESLAPEGRTGEEPWFAQALAAARAYAEEPRGWLVLAGPSGSGKTHLAAAVANQRITLGEPALFMVVPDLLDHLRASYDAEEGEPGFAPLFDQVRSAPFLVLDDIDATAATAWTKEKLYQVVNHRSLASLPTVVTTSSKRDGVDARLATRLFESLESRVVLLEGPARRGYDQVGGMTRERLAEMQFGDLAESSNWSAAERSSFRAAVTAAQQYAEEPAGWLVIMGAHGCGKTHLAAAIANKTLRRGRSVFFAVVPDLLDHLRGSFAPNAEATYDEVFERVRNVDLLVLDDFGAQKSSPWAEEKLYQVINYRTVSRLPTVVTTDLRPDGIQQVHPRVYARIFDPHHGTTIEILAPHYALGRIASPRVPGGGNPPRRSGARNW